MQPNRHTRQASEVVLTDPTPLLDEEFDLVEIEGSALEDPFPDIIAANDDFDNS